MRAGREEDYHGVAVHPRHLSRYERHVLKCGLADLTELHLVSYVPSIMAHLPRYTVLLCQLNPALDTLVYAPSMGPSNHLPFCWGRHMWNRQPLRHFAESTTCCVYVVLRTAPEADPRAWVSAGSTSSTTRSWIWRSAGRPSWRLSRSAYSAPPTASSAQTARPRRGNTTAPPCRRSRWTPSEPAARLAAVWL